VTTKTFTWNGEYSIRAQNLVKKFGELTAVDNISFDVRKGEMFAFLGPNGAGKTTTIRMLTTLLQPTSGRVELNGLNPAVEKEEARKCFGIVFQDPSLDQDLTAWENMEFHGVLYHVPGDVRRGSMVKQFSGGMKRRLEIARGLLHTPKILFLDEPTLGLDPQSHNQVRAQVRRMNEAEQVTIFLTTHYMDEAERVAQRIAVIDRGQIVATGSSQELKAKTGTNSLEAAFLALTGTSIRDEAPAQQTK